MERRKNKYKNKRKAKSSNKNKTVIFFQNILYCILWFIFSLFLIQTPYTLTHPLVNRSIVLFFIFLNPNL